MHYLLLIQKAILLIKRETNTIDSSLTSINQVNSNFYYLNYNV